MKGSAEERGHQPRQGARARRRSSRFRADRRAAPPGLGRRSGDDVKENARRPDQPADEAAAGLVVPAQQSKNRKTAAAGRPEAGSPCVRISEFILFVLARPSPPGGGLPPVSRAAAHARRCAATASTAISPSVSSRAEVHQDHVDDVAADAAQASARSRSSRPRRRVEGRRSDDEHERPSCTSAEARPRRRAPRPAARRRASADAAGGSRPAATRTTTSASTSICVIARSGPPNSDEEQRHADSRRRRAR